jgi:membrane protease YdiL (CAAX protease family)
MPFLYIKIIKKSTLREELNFKKLDIRHLKLGLLFGISSFLIMIATYFLVGHYINFDSIVAELETKSKITPTNFIFVGAYITLGNSFLEEFFFRGFIFLGLYELKSKKLSYIYSSVLFGMYHIAIFKTWFNFGLIVLALFGLIAVFIFLFDIIFLPSKNIKTSVSLFETKVNPRYHSI